MVFRISNFNALSLTVIFKKSDCRNRIPNDLMRIHQVQFICVISLRVEFGVYIYLDVLAERIPIRGYHLTATHTTLNLTKTNNLSYDQHKSP